jgi:hypothetical protein
LRWFFLLQEATLLPGNISSKKILKYGRNSFLHG